jgi:KRAB domain-containing zinc finger protein
MPKSHQKACLKRILKKLKCGHCPVKTPSKDMLLEHMRSSHGIRAPPFPCLKADCELVSSSKKAFYKHMLYQHGIRAEKDGRVKKVFAFSCQFCPVQNSFVTNEECLEHEATWHKYSCQECDHTCKSEFMLIEHNIKEHKSGVTKIDNEKKSDQLSFCCDQCGKNLASKSGLRDHMHLHEGKEVNCDKCDKVFKRMLNLNIHIKTIHSDKIFVCQHCTKECRNRRALRIHIGQYHEERRFQCNLCEKRFVDGLKLQKHTVSMHTTDRPFLCKQGCGKSFSDSSNCRQHERTVHEGNTRS